MLYFHLRLNSYHFVIGVESNTLATSHSICETRIWKHLCNSGSRFQGELDSFLKICIHNVLAHSFLHCELCKNKRDPQNDQGLEIILSLYYNGHIVWFTQQATGLIGSDVGCGSHTAVPRESY